MRRKRTAMPQKTKAGRKFRIDQSQIVAPILFDEEPTVSAASFQELIATLYGPPKIGKTTLGHLIPDIYFLATEPGCQCLPVRYSEIPNWVTFRKFVEHMEERPEQVSKVSMWCIDVADALSQMCVENIYFEWGINEMTDEGWGRAYTELRQEFAFWLLRLKALGPGILLISHERQREHMTRQIKLSKASMDLPNTTYNVVSNNSDIIMHMRYVRKSRDSSELGEMRCLSIRGDETEDAGDRTGKLPAVIKFHTEQEAVNEILACFEGRRKVHKKVKKHKKLKKRLRHRERR